jgi:MOSC domain-containing protein YiiM
VPPQRIIAEGAHTRAAQPLENTMPEGSVGTIEAVFLKQGHGEPMLAVDEALAESGSGLAGDVSFGRPKRQVLVVEAETLEHYGLKPGAIRENLVVRGVALAGAAAGTRIRAGDAVLEVTMDCAPCDFIDGLRLGLAAEMDGQRGTLCRVEAGGRIRRGDALLVEADAAGAEGRT